MGVLFTMQILNGFSDLDGQLEFFLFGFEVEHFDIEIGGEKFLDDVDFLTFDEKFHFVQRFYVEFIDVFDLLNQLFAYVVGDVGKFPNKEKNIIDFSFQNSIVV